METHLLEDPSFDIFRTILRDAVLGVWPVAAGETMLGLTLGERKRHSVLSAAAELGIHADRLRPMLIEAGALAADDPRPNARATFDVAEFSKLLEEIPRFITKKEMCEVLGATNADLDGLEAAGVLRPRTFVPGARRRWLAADAEALLDELRILAGRATDSGDDGGWTTILNAQARRGVRIEKVIAGIRAGEIQLCQTDPGVGYRGFHIAVDTLCPMPDGAQQDRNPGGSSLSEFGRSIGIREADRLLALVKAGELGATEELHPATHRQQWRVTESEMTAFRDRFVTPSMIESEFHIPRRTAVTLLEQAGIGAYSKNGQEFGRIFLRADVEFILRHDAIKKLILLDLV